MATRRKIRSLYFLFCQDAKAKVSFRFIRL